MKMTDTCGGEAIGLMHNEDCTDIFRVGFLPGKAGEGIDRYVDVLAGAKIGTLFLNTNSRRTNYRSEVWESFWDGYDPEGGDDQPFLAPILRPQVAGYRRLLDNMLALQHEGVDYPQRVIDRCRHHDIVPWISLRMNDTHFATENPAHPCHTSFFRNERFQRGGPPDHFFRGLDYAHVEVRAHFRALIEETLTRYDMDGVELDFLREPYCFRPGYEQEGARILTSWMSEIRALVDAAAHRRGHPVRLGVRVPSSPEFCAGMGLDAPRWVRDGLVDLVVVAPRWFTVEFDLPLRRWRELLGNRVTLAGGLDVRYMPHPASPVAFVSPEHAVGAAVSVLSRGGDAVYLFNFFQNSTPGWSSLEYQSLLGAMSSLDDLLTMPRRHGVTCRELVAPGESYVAPLPARGTALAFALPLGPWPLPGCTAQVLMEVGEGADLVTPPRVTVNDVMAALSAHTLQVASTTLTYDLPLSALRGEDGDHIAVETVEGKPIEVLSLEVRVTPPGR